MAVSAHVTSAVRHLLLANVNMLNTSLKFLALTLLTLFLHVSVLSQSVEKQDKLRVSLDKIVEQFNERQKNSGVPVEFTGKFATLPNELENSLSLAFPNHKFVIAKLNFFHWSWQPGVHLFLVTDKDTGDVVSFAWDLWFSGVSDSFKEFLSQYSASSSKDALSKVETLSNLLVFPTNGRVGKVKKKKGFLTSELYVRSDDPWRVLKVRVDKKFRFERIAFVNPKDGKEDS